MQGVKMCYWGSLGHIVSAEGIRMSEERVAAVNAMPFPRSPKVLRRYLGFMNYMRRHIPNISVLLKPLSEQVNNLWVNGRLWR